MTRIYIPRDLREQVAREARRRCGYCLTSEALIGAPLEIDHILPTSLGGSNEQANLWLACSLCNEFKGGRIAGIDPVTGDLFPFFDPRRQAWSDHFAWTETGDRILGLTAVGRTTVVALRLNRPSLIHARRAWVAVGWHPPQD
jgi:hypothetical protein